MANVANITNVDVATLGAATNITSGTGSGFTDDSIKVIRPGIADGYRWWLTAGGAGQVYPTGISQLNTQ